MSDVNDLAFQLWYAGLAQNLSINPNPDDPQHFYDYRKLFGEMQKNPAKYRDLFAMQPGAHFPSEFKRKGHPRYYMSPDQKQFSNKPVSGWIDTTTGKAVK